MYNSRKQLCRQEEEVSGEHVHHPVVCLPCQSAVPSEQEVHVILKRDKLLLRKTGQS